MNVAAEWLILPFGNYRSQILNVQMNVAAEWLILPSGNYRSQIITQ